MARVYVSSIVGAPVGAVWERIRNFDALSVWHPLIRESRIENADASDRVGCVRALTLQDGSTVREQLLGLSDFDLFCTYSILESSMGVENYVATLRLTPVTEGDRSFIEWSAEFDCDPAREAELVEMIGTNVFQGGFDALKQHFGG
ncbi:MAG: SRPBCC family protein [Rhodococcus sp.]|nr:SRPBCC family protein [Rhodococcus sp. (in: high G+C Gram-positive bacteria)]